MEPGIQGGLLVLSRPATMSVDSLSRLMRMYRMAQPSAILPDIGVWRDSDAERAADATMWTQADAAGLVDRQGRLADDAVDTLSVLSGARIEYFAIVNERGREYSVLVAEGAGEGVVAYRDGDLVKLTSVRAASLAETLVRQLPDHPPARIESLNVPVDQLMKAGGQESDDMDWDLGSSASKDAHTLVRINRRRLIGQGELYVAVRDHQGLRRVSGNPIRYHDVRAGRILVMHSPGYLGVAPATKKLLLTRLEEARQALAG